MIWTYMNCMSWWLKWSKEPGVCYECPLHTVQTPSSVFRAGMCVCIATSNCRLNAGNGISESRRYPFWPFCLAPLLFICPDMASRHRGGIKYLQYSKLKHLKELPVRHLSICLPLTGISGKLVHLFHFSTPRLTGRRSINEADIRSSFSARHLMTVM